MMTRWILLTCCFLCVSTNAIAEQHEPIVWLEVEQFDWTGGWSNDSQHVDIMGSPYLLATGIGKPVEDAVTTVTIPKGAKYRLWVRCRDWLPEHSPGRFQVLVGGKTSTATFGKNATDAWQWIDGGTFALEAGEAEIRLHDLTGWWGRCDAIVLATEAFLPADNRKKLEQQRIDYQGVTPDVKAMGAFDVVVVGGGPSGIGAALGAARNGCQVAFIQDRPVLGGNSSSEIEVPPMGYIGRPPDRVNISGIAKEIFPKQGWSHFADSKKIQQIVEAEKNIRLFLNTRATGVRMRSKTTIESVLALDVHSGQRMAFAAPRFIDCTGHGWIGFHAGAEYRMGQEARAEFSETLAPVEAGKRTMGNSLYKAVFRDHRDARRYPPMPGVVVRYDERDKVKLVGDWKHSSFHGGDYLTDDNTDKGAKHIRFSIPVEKLGEYDLFLGYYAYVNRATNVPVTVVHAEGKTAVTVDQRSNTLGWKKLGTFRLDPKQPSIVTVSNEGTADYVVAESIRFVTKGTKPIPLETSKLEPVPFDCPQWAYQWHKSSDFEPHGSHRRIREIVRPENYDRPAHGKGRNPGNDINGAILHAWWVEYGGMLNTIEDAEKIRDELFRISIGLWNYAKNHNPNTIERNTYRELIWLNYVPGVRESRRIVGDYIMSQRDYDDRIVHPDTIAFTDWGPDVHHPEGYWVDGNDCIHVYQGRRTSIPYRTLYSKTIDNLFMAGRCHSATHIALGGTRVMRPMCATGQAAGTAAAIAQKHSTTPRGVYAHHISELQQTLLKDGCYLMGVRNTDENDLARTATATASSEAVGTAATKVINGFNRIVDKDRNAWAFDPKSSSPQWLQLQFAETVECDTLHVTFERQCSECQAQVFENDTWRTVATIENTTARRTVCRFSLVKTCKIRLLFGTPSQNTSVCELRVYCEQRHAGNKSATKA